MLILLSEIIKNKDFKAYETDSNLLVMKENETYDILFMGISHARDFSKYNNHLLVEEILNKRMFNIGQGAGRCGVNEQLFFLDYFFYRRNTVSTLVYFISTPMFYSENLALTSITFDMEPFEIPFLLRYLSFPSENKNQRIVSYFQSKFMPSWFLHKPYSGGYQEIELTGIDTEAVLEGQRAVYSDSLALRRFEINTKIVEKTVQLALDNNCEVILIIPPALFGKWIGHEKVEEFAKALEKIDNVKFYDFSESIMIPEFYYDHHHLNSKGIVHFTERFLEPAIEILD